ncbi:MAG: tRNA (adenosine(37)-N6)-threonylcarbamoyltransferase complex dimerization subunit type 1 TsaB [bacterium]|nr:tRNA (adenosine(37)-N6)-threonylcarbamoyltransferase complex dimerization subunit type 1 TsaB [bacterium]
MLLIAIDTSTHTGAVALRDERGLIGQIAVNVKLTHSEGLMPAVDALLQRCGVTPRDLEAVGCCSGPGSFTGLRVGMATAQGLAAARGLPCAAIPALEALAWAVPFVGVPYCPISTARKGWLYARRYQWSGGAPEPLSDELYLTFDELIAKIHQPTLIYGPALAEHRVALRETLGGDFVEGPDSLNVPNPAILAERAAQQIAGGGAISAAELVPHYLAPSQAEVVWREREPAASSKQ